MPIPGVLAFCDFRLPEDTWIPNVTLFDVDPPRLGGIRTLTEISSQGFRILVRESNRPLHVSLLLPRELVGGREIQLPGQVVRSERKSSDVVSLSVLFEELEMDVRLRLDAFLATLLSGPLALAG